MSRARKVYPTFDVDPSVGFNVSPDVLYEVDSPSSVAVLEPEEAGPREYITDRKVIVPTARRAPTEEELERLTSPEADYAYRLELLKLPRAFGEKALQLCGSPPDSANFYPNAPSMEMVEGVYGSYAGYRTDEPHLPSTTVKSREDPRYVGMHLDGWEGRPTFIVANLGPGERWHGVSPYITRDHLTEVKSRDVKAWRHYIQDATKDGRITPDMGIVHWVNLPPPTPTEIYAITSPAGYAIHDGATGAEPSTVVLAEVLPHSDLADYRRYPQASR